MMRAYVDTSVILRLVLGEKNPFRTLPKFGSLYTSQLTVVESNRAIDCFRIKQRWTSQHSATRLKALKDELASFEIIPLQPSILQRAAEPFLTIIKTLDAMHLASAILMKNQLGQPLLFVTHDVQQAHTAIACGFSVDGLDEE